jgi:hypothetical protein
MAVLTPRQIDRIHEVTDALGLHRNWVIVTLVAVADGVELVQPDSKLLIRAPGGDAFESWFSGLRRRLETMNLGKVARGEDPDRRDKNLPGSPSSSPLTRGRSWGA